MPRTIFLANVGNRDVYFNLGTETEHRFVPYDNADKNSASVQGQLPGMIPSDCPNTRAIATYLAHNDNFEQHRWRLKFPIIAPALQWLKGRLQNKGKVLDQMILIATDQPKADTDHHPWDTEPSARLIEKLIRQDARFAGWLSEIKIDIVTIDNDANQYGANYEQLSRKLTASFGEDSYVYALTAGGIASGNAALRTLVLNRQGPRAKILEAIPPEDRDRERGQESRIIVAETWLHRRDELLRIIRPLLSSYEYSAAKRLIEQSLRHEEARSCKDILDVLEHGARRLNLDFDAAATVLANPTNDLITGFQQSARQVTGNAQRLHEVAFTATVALARSDLGSFITRVATFSETARRVLAAHLLCVNLDGEKIDKRSLGLGVHQNLIDRGTAHVPCKDGKYDINNWSLNGMLNHKLPKRGTDHPPARAARSAIDRLDRVSDRRNEHAHQARPATHKSINEAMGMTGRQFADGDGAAEVVSRMTSVLDAIQQVFGDTSARKNVYPEINQFVLGRLESTTL